MNEEFFFPAFFAHGTHIDKNGPENNSELLQ